MEIPLEMKYYLASDRSRKKIQELAREGSVTKRCLEWEVSSIQIDKTAEGDDMIVWQPK